MKEKTLIWKEKLQSFLQEKGMYVVVFASLAIIGTAAALGTEPKGEAGKPAASLETPAPLSTESAAPVAERLDERLEEKLAFLTPAPTPTAKPTPTLVPDFTQKPEAKSGARKTNEPRKAVSPVKGQVIWQFAQDELIYSVTLQQWMTHQGADISAALESEVHCILDGTVQDVFSDDAFGVTVVVVHEGELKSVYANLMEDPPVKAGSKLKAGATLGYVGNSALSECESASHLHLEIWKGGKAVDPAEYCLFES